MSSQATFRICLLLFLGTLAVYVPLSAHGFVSYDDPKYVTANPVVKRGLTGDGVAWAFTTFHASNWHPLTWLSHMLDVQLFGVNPGAHHFVSLLLHAANAVLLFLLLSHMTESPWRSALVAALFALHPLHVESVAWVAERKDVLSTFFGLLAIGAYLRYAQEPRLSAYLLLAVAFALSLLAKPMLVTLPFVLLLLDYWPLRRWPGAPGTLPQAEDDPFGPARVSRGWLVVEKLPLLALSAAACVVTVMAQHAGGAVAPLEGLSLPARLGNAVLAYVVYLRKTVWPVDLAVLYPHAGEQVSWPEAAGAAALLVAVTAAVFWWRRRCPSLLVGWLWFVGTLVPVLGLVQVGNQALADRYTYFPLVGLFLGVVFALPVPRAEDLRGHIVGVTAGLVVVAACAAGTLWQLRTWRDDLALWERAVAVTPRNVTAQTNLGVALLSRGRLDEAEAALHAAVAANDKNILARNTLGRCLLQQGKTQEARTLIEETLRLDPKQAATFTELGLAAWQAGNPSEALTWFAFAVKLEPATAEHHFNLATTLEESGEHEAALAAYAEGLKRDPGFPSAASLWAWHLVTREKEQWRSPAEALFRAKQACQATENRRPEMLDVLAAVQAERGEFSGAITTAKRALEQAEKVGNVELAKEIRARIKLYQERRKVGGEAAEP